MTASRKILALFLETVALLAGFYFTLDKLRVTTESQLAERFAQSVDQLASENIELRLGGIYALERIAQGSETDYWPVMEILTTYYPEYIPEPIDDLIRSRHDIKLPREVMRPGDPRWYK